MPNVREWLLDLPTDRFDVNDPDGAALCSRRWLTQAAAAARFLL